MRGGSWIYGLSHSSQSSLAFSLWDLLYIFFKYVLIRVPLLPIDLFSLVWDIIFWRWQQQPLPACKLQQQVPAFLLLAEFSRQVLQFLVEIPRRYHGISLQVHAIYHLYNLSSGALHHHLLNLIRLLQKQCLKLLKTSLSQGCQLIWEVSFRLLSFLYVCNSF